MNEVPPTGEKGPLSSKKKIAGLFSALASVVVFGCVMSYHEHETRGATKDSSTTSPQFVISKSSNEWKDFICTRNGTQYAEWSESKVFQLANKGTKTLWGIVTPSSNSKPQRFITDSSEGEKCGFINR